MSIKDQVKKQNEGAVKQEETKGNRKSGGVTEDKPVSMENPQFVPTFTFGGSASAAEWFLDRTGDMAVVTDQDHNLELGIKRIQAFGASAGQQAFGTIANVTIETLFGTVTGIQVRESQRNRGVLFIGTSSRKVQKEGQDAQYYNDVELSRPAQAQILSWIHPQLNPNK